MLHARPQCVEGVQRRRYIYHQTHFLRDRNNLNVSVSCQGSPYMEGQTCHTGREVRRRLCNMDSLHTQSEVVETLKTFSQKMADSGYNISSRQEILRSLIRKHFRELGNASKEGISIYSTCQKMNQKKEVAPLLKRSWFRSRKGGTQVRLEK